MAVIGIVTGLTAFAVLFWTGEHLGMPENAVPVAALAVLMAVWWVSEAIPLAATALLPIVLLPWLSVSSPAEVANAYANPLIFLFLGGFLIAIAMQRWQLHRRIALETIRRIGYQPRRLLLGFMLSTAFLSMWISNTATALMMLPIALAISEVGDKRFASRLLLAIAYGASIGGVATLIGTPPNAILAGLAYELYGYSIGFAQWMAFGVPLSAVMLCSAGWYLTRRMDSSFEDQGGGQGSGQLIADELARLGPLSVPERRVLMVFSAVAGLWIIRDFLPAEWFGRIDDAGVGLCGALLLFISPSGRPGQRLLDWESAKSVPWDVLILFGGGFALAGAFQSTGLSEWLGQRLTLLEAMPTVLILASTAALVLMLTELTSNTATATLLIPVLGAFAAAAGLPVLSFMVVVAVTSSYAFMLPVATPPNAVVFGSHRLSIREMARTGIVLNLIALVLVTLFVMQWLPRVWPIGISVTTG